MNVQKIYSSKECKSIPDSFEYKDLSVSLETLLVQHPTTTFIGRAAGNSMQGVGIFDGDILVIDRALNIKNGDVIVAVFNGEFVCKILDTERKMLISASDDYPAVSINTYDDFAIEGIVSQSIRMYRGSSVLVE